MQPAAADALDPAIEPALALRRLPAPVQALCAVVARVYAGSLRDCAEDVRRRRAGRPFLVRFDIDGLDPLPWLNRLMAYEAARGVPVCPAAA